MNLPSSLPFRDDPGIDDATIISCIRADDGDAFDGLVRVYYSELVNFAVYHLRASDEAEDLVSEVFAWLWEHRATWRPQTTIRVYLLTAVRHRALNRLRNQRRTTALQQKVAREPKVPAMGNSPTHADATVEHKERQAAIERALSTLQEPARTIVILRWLKQLEFNEIAEIMEMTPAAVQMQLSRAMKALRATMSAD